MSSSTALYYCHQCARNITPTLPDYICPQCEGGFIEELENPPTTQQSGLPPSFASLFNLPGSRSNDPFGNQNSSGEDDDLVPNGTPGMVLRSRPRGGGATRGTRRGRGMRVRTGPHGASITITANGPGNDDDEGMGFYNQVLQNLLTSIIEGAPVMTSGTGGGVIFNPGDYAWGPDGLDAIITQLFNNLEGTGPPPATEDQIEAIPTEEITPVNVEKEEQCPVCFDNFSVGEEVKMLKCEHKYHPGCIDPWLKLHGTCPVCRKDLNGNIVRQESSGIDFDAINTAVHGGSSGNLGGGRRTNNQTRGNESATSRRNPNSTSHDDTNRINTDNRAERRTTRRTRSHSRSNSTNNDDNNDDDSFTHDSSTTRNSTLTSLRNSRTNQSSTSSNDTNRMSSEPSTSSSTSSFVSSFFPGIFSDFAHNISSSLGGGGGSNRRNNDSSSVMNNTSNTSDISNINTTVGTPLDFYGRVTDKNGPGTLQATSVTANNNTDVLMTPTDDNNAKDNTKHSSSVGNNNNRRRSPLSGSNSKVTTAAETKLHQTISTTANNNNATAASSTSISGTASTASSSSRNNSSNERYARRGVFSSSRHNTDGTPTIRFTHHHGSINGTSNGSNSNNHYRSTSGAASRSRRQRRYNDDFGLD